MHLPPGVDADRTGLVPSDVAAIPAFWPRVWGVDGTVLHTMHLSRWRSLKWGASCPRFAVSEWQGVKTDASHAVVELGLGGLGLQGPLPKCILRRVVRESRKCLHRLAFGLRYNQCPVRPRLLVWYTRVYHLLKKTFHLRWQGQSPPNSASSST